MREAAATSEQCGLAAGERGEPPRYHGLRSTTAPHGRRRSSAGISAQMVRRKSMAPHVPQHQQRGITTVLGASVPGIVSSLAVLPWSTFAKLRSNMCTGTAASHSQGQRAICNRILSDGWPTQYVESTLVPPNSIVTGSKERYYTCHSKCMQLGILKFVISPTPWDAVVRRVGLQRMELNA